MKLNHLLFKTLAMAAVALATTFTPNQLAAQEAKAEPVKAEPAKAEPAKAEPTKPVARKVVGEPKVRPLSVTVDLVSETKIAGTLTDTTQLDMQTSFGSVPIPLSEVAGIKFASADDPSTTVVMLNGDSITGATDVKLITVETEWGTATINGVSIASILFVPGLSWNSQSGLNGNRWNLAEQKKEAPPAAPPTTRPQPVQQSGRPVQSGQIYQGGNFRSFPGR